MEKNNYVFDKHVVIDTPGLAVMPSDFVSCLTFRNGYFTGKVRVTQV